MAEFRDADPAEAIARHLIGQHHSHLVEAEIRYLFRDGDWASQGQTVLGKAYKVSARDKFLTGHDFLVVLNGDTWKDLTMEQRRALVDHELCHLGKDEDADGNPRWVIWGHDVEEFRSIIERHGLWKPDLKQFGESAARKVTQATLFDQHTEQALADAERQAQPA